MSVKLYSPLLAAALLSAAAGAAQRAASVKVTASGTDNFTTADYHTIENTGTVNVSSATIDISVVPGAFWDFDGGASFGNALAPVVTSTNYGGTVSWSFAGTHPTSVTANFSPSLAPGEWIKFGADTDFFVSDPCPGQNFGLAPATVSALFDGGASCTTGYVVVTPTLSEAACSGGCTAPTLSVTGLVAGGTATLTVDCATPGGLVALGYSLAGGGPINASAGACGVVTAPLSPPVTELPAMPANGAGTLSVNVNVPPGTTGVNVWVAALDLGSCVVTNGFAGTIG